MRTWRTLAGVDKQCIEGVHPQFNKPVRRFDDTRGKRKQQMVMDAFLFSHSTWLVETVEEMLKETKRKRSRGKNAGQQDQNNSRSPAVPPELEPIESPRDVTSLSEGAMGADEVDARQGCNVAVDDEPSRRNNLEEG